MKPNPSNPTLAVADGRYHLDDNPANGAIHGRALNGGPMNGGPMNGGPMNGGPINGDASHGAATRSSDRWQSRPGNFDALNAAHLFPTDNEWGVPCLSAVPRSRLPRWLAPYRTRIRSQQPLHDGALHFFLDDYRFETVWNRPRQVLPALQGYATLLTPDFSLYRDWPRTLQIWNVYRNRWCGAFWQSLGYAVIPTISWGGASSFDFCFLGVPLRSFVAVSTVGLKLDQPWSYHLFLDGFQEMIRRLRPSAVLCYGSIPAACRQMIEVICYPTRWDGIRAARKGAARSNAHPEGTSA